jgi:RNA recognition motif-containing protein
MSDEDRRSKSKSRSRERRYRSRSRSVDSDRDRRRERKRSYSNDRRRYDDRRHDNRYNRRDDRDGGYHQREHRERRPPPEGVDQLFTLKVDNIDFSTTNATLQEEFSKFGEVGDVYIPRKFGSSEPRGFAFVRFINAADGIKSIQKYKKYLFKLITFYLYLYLLGEEAAKELDGKFIHGREIRIQEAKEKRVEKQNFNNNYNRGGYNDRHGGYRDRYNDRGRDNYNNYGRDRRSRSRSPPRRDDYSSRDDRRHDDRR